MRLLYLTRNMGGYLGATYQREFLAAIEQVADTYAWGPGYSQFSQDLNWKELKALLPWEPDAIITGHSWLVDTPNEPLNPQPALDLASIDIPKVFVLNKEYTRLEEKLQFAADMRPTMLVSHHHLVDKYAHQVGATPHFMPFAVAKDRVLQNKVQKDVDVSFTGILINPFHVGIQSDFRLVVQRELFASAWGVPIVKRRRYRRVRIQWRGVYGDYRDRWARLSRHGRLSEEGYWDLLRRSHSVVNGLSPLGLIGTRFFETLASSAIPLAEESSLYKHVPGLSQYLLQVNSDGGNLHETITWILENPVHVRRLTELGAREVLARHTWEARSQDLIVAMKRQS